MIYADRVRPLAGARIETTSAWPGSRARPVRPLAGARIETLLTCRVGQARSSSPLAGARIETAPVRRATWPSAFAPSRGRGLKRERHLARDHGAAGSPPRGARIDATPPIGCSEMALIFTAEHVVRRISADHAPIAEPGAVGIRPEPAAAILRRHGGQTRRAPGRGRMQRAAEIAESGGIGDYFFVDKAARGTRSYLVPHSLAHYEVGRVARMKGGTCRRPRGLKCERAIFHIGS
jgi:hypothetical protein